MERVSGRDFAFRRKAKSFSGARRCTADAFGSFRLRTAFGEGKTLFVGNQRPRPSGRRLAGESDHSLLQGHADVDPFGILPNLLHFARVFARARSRTEALLAGS